MSEKDEKNTGLMNLGQNVVAESDLVAIEKALVSGDLASMTTAQRIIYVRRTCDSLGLNPLTSPFGYITFDGKMRLYAKKDCAEQLGRIHKVSIKTISREKIDTVYVVSGRGTTSDGREIDDIGVVAIAGYSGKDLANALMKAETKMKRRVTLSICGLGILDESELETIPDSKTFEVTAEAPKTQTAKPADEENAQISADQTNILLKEIKNCGWTLPDLKKLMMDLYKVGSPPKLKNMEYREILEIIKTNKPADYFNS